MNELDRIVQFFEDMSARELRTGLATVVKTEGPSYRSPGSRSLICENGTYVGGLSAGCLEADIACRLDGAKYPFMVSYDLSSADDVRGFPFGCGGNVQIHVEPIRCPAQLDFVRWVNGTDEPAVLVTPIRGGEDANGVHFATTHSGNAFGRLLWHAQIDACIQTAFSSKTSRCVRLEDGVELFIEYFEPPVHVTIFGDGEDALALAELGESVGMSVERFSRRDLRSDQRLPLKRNAFFVVMTHDLNLDTTAVGLAISTSPRYLGIMGPRSRTERLYALLTDEERRMAEEMEIHAPIGLDMAAETPREIALSIASEIQTIARGRKPAHLCHGLGAIHDRGPVVEDIKTVGRR
ncbi:MAG TPA: XdhC family protein [Candidatus Obscuribacterales bacterium]